MADGTKPERNRSGMYNGLYVVRLETINTGHAGLRMRSPGDIAGAISDERMSGSMRRDLRADLFENYLANLFGKAFRDFFILQHVA